MTAAAHLLAFLLCTLAAWATIGAIRRDRDDPPTVRIKLAALIAGPPLLLLTIGIPFTTVIGYYLTGFILIYGLIYGLTLLVAASRHGLDTTLREPGNLTHSTAADQPPGRGQQRRTQGPRPPEKAIRVDEELAWDKTVLFRDSGFDGDRYLRMLEALDREEYEELEQFWRWQRTTGQTPSDTGTGQQPGPPRTDEHGRPIIFDDQR